MHKIQWILSIFCAHLEYENSDLYITTLGM